MWIFCNCFFLGISISIFSMISQRFFEWYFIFYFYSPLGTVYRNSRTSTVINFCLSILIPNKFSQLQKAADGKMYSNYAILYSLTYLNFAKLVTVNIFVGYTTYITLSTNKQRHLISNPHTYYTLFTVEERSLATTRINLMWL